MALFNPYENVNWNSVQLVQSMSHEHRYHIGSSEQAIDELYTKGFRHFAFTEYHRDLPIDTVESPEDKYASAPIYPLTRWHSSPPQDVIASPSSEVAGHGGHLITLGSLAGHAGHNCDRFEGIEPPCGRDGADMLTAIWNESENKPIRLSEQESFQYVLDGINDPNGEGTIGGLLYADAGGMYEAHSGGFPQIVRRLDFDSRFIGCDFYNDRRDPDNQLLGRVGRGWNTIPWSEVLSTGRRCIGFGESDRGNRGCNILLLDEFTDYDALKKYRNGGFYGKMKWGDDTLKFINIEDQGDRLIAECEGASNGMRVFSEKGVVAESSGNTIEYIYPVKNGEIDLTFLRVEAMGKDFEDFDLPEIEQPIYHWYDTDKQYEDSIYSQAIMFRDAYSGTTAIAENFFDRLTNVTLQKVNEANSKYETALDLLETKPTGQGNPVNEANVRERLDRLNRKISGSKNKIYFAADVI